MEELKKLLEEQRKAFEDFKAANDARIKAVETKGTADATVLSKVDKANEDLGALQKRMDDLAIKLNRPGRTDPDEKAAQEKERAEAFSKFVRTNGLMGKAASVGVDADGGHAIPETLDRNIGVVAQEANPMRGVCNVLSLSNEEYRKLFDVGGTSSGWVGETDPRPGTNTPKLAELKPVFGEIYANPASTQKALDDLFFDVESWLTNSVGREFAKQEDDAFLNGDGNAKPKGILAYTLAETADAARTFGQLEKLTTAAAAAIAADELISLIYKLNPEYRQNARFMTSRLTVSALRKLKDGQNNYLWQPSFQAGQPSKLLDFPLVENEKVPAIAATKPTVLFGDFKRTYTIIDVRGIRILRDPYTNKPYVHFYTTKRVGGLLEDSNAMKVLVQKA